MSNTSHAAKISTRLTRRRWIISPGVTERDLPKYVIVSDFARFRLYNLEENEQHEFDLKDLHKNVRLFGFIAGYQTHKIQEQDPVNIKAAEQMGKLHDQMKDAGYSGHPLELVSGAAAFLSVCRRHRHFRAPAV